MLILDLFDSSLRIDLIEKLVGFWAMPIYISSLSILELEGPSFTISLTAVFSSPAKWVVISISASYLLIISSNIYKYDI